MQKKYNFIQNRQVPPKSYSKQDVRKLYSNSGTTYFSRQKLKRLIADCFKQNNNKKIYLKDELSKIGYQKQRHYFTLPECSLIFEFLGPPELNQKNIYLLFNKGFIESKELEKYNIPYK